MRDLEQAIEAREKRLADMEKSKKWNVEGGKGLIGRTGNANILKFTKL